MDDEEAERLLRALRASLGERSALGGGPARHALPDENEDVDARLELRRVLDEYEAVLVDAPKMLQQTMKLIGAESITFTSDPGDARFGLRPAIDDGGSDAFAGVTVSHDSLGEWLAIALEATQVIAELRGRLDEQPR